jgi:uncharacterized membrane protein YgcG
MFAQAEGGWFDFLHTMRGPDFLLLYFIWFIVTFGTVLLFRWRGKDTPLVTLGGLACYELLGLVRIIVGSMHGMQKWDFLILMMVIGGVIFLIRASFNQSNGDGGSWWSSNCSSGSSCGGGGGCGSGGGCGGCGGS